MPYFGVDDGMYDHPKFDGVSDTAVALWTKAGSWASGYLTDGVVPTSRIAKLGYQESAAAELVRAGLWVNVRDGYAYHQWSEHQQIKSEVEAQRTRWRDEKRKQRSLKSRDIREMSGPDSASESGQESHCPSPLLSSPLLSDPLLPKPTTKKKRETAAPAAAAAPREKLARPPKAETADAWAAYSSAYQRRYGELPVRNAKVNGQLGQLVARISAAEAGDVARHYLASNNSRYVAAGHSVGCLLQDAEKLRTEWATGRAGTAFAARQADKRAGRGEEYESLFAEMRALDEARGVSP